MAEPKPNRSKRVQHFIGVLRRHLDAFFREFTEGASSSEAPAKIPAPEKPAAPPKTKAAEAKPAPKPKAASPKEKKAKPPAPSKTSAKPKKAPHPLQVSFTGPEVRRAFIINEILSPPLSIQQNVDPYSRNP